MESETALYVNYLPVLLGGVVGFILVFTALIGARLLAPFSKENQKILLYGNIANKRISRLTNKQFTGEHAVQFEGVIPNLERRYQNIRPSLW